MNPDPKAKIISLLILLFGMLGLPTISQAETYYIDGVSGNDINPGTLGNPFKTMGAHGYNQGEDAIPPNAPTGLRVN